MSNPTGAVSLHRMLRAPVERVYKAFTDKQALEYWTPPYGFTGEIESMDVRVGGGYSMAFTNFSSGTRHSFRVEFVELVPNAFIRQTDRFDDENLSGEMLVTVELKAVEFGTELRITQEGIPALIPVEQCYLGWQESLEQLGKLVEPEVPG